MFKSALAFPLLWIALSAGVAPEPATLPLEIALTRSVPEAESEVEAPQELRLWFSEAPQTGSTSIRLVDFQGHVVPVGEANPDSADATAYSAAIPKTLAPGRYSVVWRATGADGLPVRKMFGFTVVGTADDPLGS